MHYVHYKLDARKFEILRLIFHVQIIAFFSTKRSLENLQGMIGRAYLNQMFLFSYLA